MTSGNSIQKDILSWGRQYKRIVSRGNYLQELSVVVGDACLNGWRRKSNGGIHSNPIYLQSVLWD